VTLGRLLSEAGLTLALAESCTGGLVAHRVTNVPGSSAYFLGGVVSYSNEAKQRILGVAPATLDAHGAVSEETAGEMARGARRLFGADLAASVTGIAGPGGGTPDKPVGLVYVAVSSRAGERCERFLWSGDREANKRESAQAVLRMLVEQVQSLPQVPKPAGGSPPDQPADVEARCELDGRIVPARFVVKGQPHAVTSIGRAWDVAGEGRHILVMDERGRVRELLLRLPALEWRLVRRAGGETEGIA